MCVTTDGEFTSKTSIKPTYATVQKETQKEHTYTVDGLVNEGDLYPGELISGIIYSFANGWAYFRGGLKPGGGFIVRYSTELEVNFSRQAGSSKHGGRN